MIEINKIMVVFGTRPEAIKMCPLINELKNRKKFQVFVCVTGQHREMLDQVLKVFGVIPDFDLNIMKDRQSLFDVTSSILEKINIVLDDTNPDLVLVHGDTSTAFATALACFYKKIKVGHVEAGLRTYDLDSPFPEEFNREAISLVSYINFAPTIYAKQNLISENREKKRIFVTGNTVIDALKTTVNNDFHHKELEWIGDSRFIFITAHRRENLGEPMHNMFKAIRKVLDENPDIKAIYPIHLNPQIRLIAKEEFNGCNQIHIIEPIDVFECHNFESRCFVCLTDSGGIQEECPTFGKPVLVMRNTTERPEGVDAGVLKLVGTSKEKIYESLNELINNPSVYREMSTISNPYGDGMASKRIADILEGKKYEEFKEK